MTRDRSPCVGAVLARKSVGARKWLCNSTRFEAPLRSRDTGADGINSAIFSGEIGQGLHLDRNCHVRLGSGEMPGGIYLTYLQESIEWGPPPQTY